jgi:putative oxidoreductase
MTKLLFLNVMAKFSDPVFALFRILVGVFLIWGVWDNIVDPLRMAEFADFLEKFQFPHPEFMARLSVWVQFLCGFGIALGLIARWCGLFCAINFVVAVAMADIHGGVRQAYPAAMLVAFGLYLLSRGAGRISVDNLLERRIASS